MYQFFCGLHSTLIYVCAYRYRAYIVVVNCMLEIRHFIEAFVITISLFVRSIAAVCIVPGEIE